MFLFNIISTVWAVISFTLLLIAWRMAVAGKTKIHKYLMIFLTSGAWVFIASYLIQRPYGIADISLPREFIIWIAFHGTLGLILLIGATCLVVSRLRIKDNRPESHLNRHHKLYGKVFIVLWLFSHIGGVFNAFYLS
jgi:uncharacterized membrane protein YozB (DUF420 family)